MNLPTTNLTNLARLGLRNPHEMNFRNRHLQEITLLGVMHTPPFSSENDDPGSISFSFVFDGVQHRKQLNDGSYLPWLENTKAIAYFRDEKNAQSLTAFICIDSEIIVGMKSSAFAVALFLPLLLITGSAPLFASGLLPWLITAMSIGASIYLLRNFKIHRILKQALEEKNEKNRP